MKKVILLSMVALFLMGAISFAAGTFVPVLRWDATNTTWTSVATPAIASATAVNTWTSSANDGILDPSYTVGGVPFSILPATPTWTQIPRITWNVHISQWIYISIQYLDYYIHADLPGKYMTDDLSIHVVSNANTYVYFATGGDLTDGTNTMPTYMAAFLSGVTHPGAPWTGDWSSITSLPNGPTNYMTVSTAGDQTFHVWFGFEVGVEQPKGDYMTYVDTFIQSDP